MLHPLCDIIYTNDCRAESEANNCAVCSSNVGFVCDSQEYNLHATTVARVCQCDHEVEMEPDVERRRRLTRVRVQREADQHRHNLICASVGQPLVASSRNLPLLNGVTAPVSWLIYECGDTIEQRMIPGGSNDKKLTDVGTQSSSIIISLPTRLSCVHSRILFYGY